MRGVGATSALLALAACHVEAASPAGGGAEPGDAFAQDAAMDAGSASRLRPAIVFPDDATFDGGLDASVDSETPDICTCRAAGARSPVPALPLALLVVLGCGRLVRLRARRGRRDRLAAGVVRRPRAFYDAAPWCRASRRTSNICRSRSTGRGGG